MTRPVDPRLAALRAHAADAVSFQALESSMRWWYDAAPPAGTGAAVAYVEAGRSWVAVGRPLTAPDRHADAARRFCEAARQARRRVVFFGVEDLSPFAGFRRLAIGRQSVLYPARWPDALRASRRLREQLRRARAKGVRVRVVSADELDEGRPLRDTVERLRSAWLASRHMEPLGFLVAVEPFHAPAEHFYLLAERRGEPVEFLSAVPIYTRRGWLIEDVLRTPRAPNGTTELVLDTAMRELAGESRWLTPGVTPLVDAAPWWLRAIRALTAPLYDFSGLYRFRARLGPARWDPVWLVWDRGSTPAVVIDVLRAFAGGALWRFGLRSIVRHPTGPPWLVTLPLVPWTLLLAGLSMTGRSELLGFHPAVFHAWIVFDAGLAWLLFRAARRPRPRILALLASCAAFDAVVSIRHLADVGLGDSWHSAVLRLLATSGPIVGTAALAWAAQRARQLARLARARY